MSNTNTQDVKFSTPPLIVRQKSAIIDAVTIILLMYLATTLLEMFNIYDGSVRIVLFVLILLYEPIMVWQYKTLGQAFMGIKVRKFEPLRDTNTYQNIGFFSSIIRYIIKIILGIISFLTIHSDLYGRAIHDQAAGSVMVND
jgi:uncharacterized RDD family membrane protein YckC